MIRNLVYQMANAVPHLQKTDLCFRKIKFVRHLEFFG
jgi:hypothetical protein